ncbi:hypothetical protein INT80_01120 [Gallibacterium anatis]|uniref:Uncharacterized protein n=1 Tax=Gallibacterium anatis TaxID=750 RepID=A0A930Y4Q0_9PAST|nr:hypothetical protein [Gallibacterium anatis]
MDGETPNQFDCPIAVKENQNTTKKNPSPPTKNRRRSIMQNRNLGLETGIVKLEKRSILKSKPTFILVRGIYAKKWNQNTIG